jgi:hypothetical protein
VSLLVSPTERSKAQPRSASQADSLPSPDSASRPVVVVAHNGRDLCDSLARQRATRSRLTRCPQWTSSGSAGGDRCSSRKRAVLPRKGAKRCWQPRAAVGSRKPDRSPDCRDLDELLRSTLRSGCRTSDRSRTSTPPWATRSPTELQRQARRAGAAAAGPDPHDDATRSRCPAPPQAVSPDPYFPDSERMSRTPRRAPAPPPPARRAARATRRRPRQGNRR